MKSLRRLSKLLHEIGSAGLLGGVAAELVFAALARRDPAAAIALRRGIVALSDWVLFPSVLLLAFSGILSTLISRALWNAVWVWLKMGLGVPLVEVSLGPLRSGARDAAALLAQAAVKPLGPADAEALADALHRERSAVWMIIVLSVLNIALAIWRPRLVAREPRSD